MASQPPTLPPSALAGAAANAKIDQIAVRIILMPDSARTNQPKHLTGTVEGQNPDGTLKVKTDIGELRILLRDKGNLPQGMKIEIDIPAGRNPQQANIRQSDSAPVSSAPSPQTKPAPSSSPSLAQTLSEQPDAPIKINPETGKPYIAPQQTGQIPTPTKLQPEMLGNVITSQAATIIDKSLPIPIAAGSVQAGQIVRLLPIPPNSLPQNVMETLTKPLSIPDLISNLVNVIENLPKGETQLRTTLITILSRLDFSVLASLKPPQSFVSITPIATSAHTTTPAIPLATLPNGLPVIPPSGIQPSGHTTLIAKIDALVQSIGLPPPFKSLQTNPSIQVAPTSLSLFNPSKSVDGQVLAFQNPTFSILAPSSAPPLAPLPTSLSASLPLQSNVTPLQTPPVSPSQVLGFTQNGLPILSVPLPNTGMTQIYSMQFKADNLNAGTPVFIALDPASTKPTQAMFIQSADGGISLDQNLSKTTLNGWINSGTWDSLDDLLQNISHLSPTHGQNFAQMMPTPTQPNTMGALNLFFLSMMRSGDTDGWIANEAVSLLRQMGKSDLLRAVTSDMAVASRVDTMTLSQDWRMTMLPLLWENQIHKTPLYYKNLPDDGDKDGADDKKRRRLRFLFDLNMSRMGGVQIDGFMQSERLDIILRAKSPFSPPMQTQMKRIYAGAMEKSRLTGELSFQFKPEQWVDLSQSTEKTGLHA